MDGEHQGVSVVICCYNSAQRLPETLAHLAAQEVSGEIPWEVVVVDNASTDETADVARQLWLEDAPAPLRVVPEPRAGLSFARERGFQGAQYEYVSFVDDDNWVSPDWVGVVYDVMHQHPEVGACGGGIEAVPEVIPPSWFEQYKRNYAVGVYDDEGDITDQRDWLLGAGLTIRKQAWNVLHERGFRSLLTGRKGKSLSAGEEFELCFAMIMAGWRLWYEPRLHLRHFIPEERLTWDYLRRLHRGFGRTTVVHEVYRAHLRADGKVPTRSWWTQSVHAFKRLLYYYRLAVQDDDAILSEGFEGSRAIINFEHARGRLYELLRRRKAYERSFSTIRALQERLNYSPVPVRVP